MRQMDLVSDAATLRSISLLIRCILQQESNEKNENQSWIKKITVSSTIVRYVVWNQYQHR